MLRRTLNLGILAHVDAGKTTLTERLLYTAGVIDDIGSVDKGTTQTDTLSLERRRGITIKSAVVSFSIDDVIVNLIDTPGHPDFIAEVERVLCVLDGAVLVVSAVEGVQPQTRLLMRALQRLRVPTLVFVNKIDRAGADEALVLAAISERLTPSIVPLGRVLDSGTRSAGFEEWEASDAAFTARLATVLAENDDRLLTALVEEERLDDQIVRQELAAQTRRALVHPVLSGSALTGAGIESLTRGIAELLPAAAGDADGPLTGRVFKIERGPAGEKVAFLRMFSGTVRTRDRVRFGDDVEAKVTAIRVFDDGSVEHRAVATAGEIAKVWGLRDARIGDTVGEAVAPIEQQFAPPTLESAVVPDDPEQREALRVALGQLAEQDPLIDVRLVDHELSVSLYGEVQKEVIQATLSEDFGVAATFCETTTICVERPRGTGEAIEILPDDANPFSATIGLRVEPAPLGSGLTMRLDVDPRSVPLYIYGTAERFRQHLSEYVADVLGEGLCGWQVIDCAVTLYACDYYVGDGRAKPTAPTPRTTAADFRKLTPLVLMQALERAGTTVCEPVLRVRLDVPATATGAVLAAVGRLGGVAHVPARANDPAPLETILPVGRVQDLQRQLPGLTAGEGVLDTEFDGYRPVPGTAPSRVRTTPNPLNREEYLMHLARRVRT